MKTNRNLLLHHHPSSSRVVLSSLSAPGIGPTRTSFPPGTRRTPPFHFGRGSFRDGTRPILIQATVNKTWRQTHLFSTQVSPTSCSSSSSSSSSVALASNHHTVLSSSPSTTKNSGSWTPHPTATPTTRTTTFQSMNMFTAINEALSIALQTDPTAIVFGEDVAFGGVFRCTQQLRSQFGPDRVFNTPLSENGIAGLAIGYAATGGTAIAEIQFADYLFPAMDQIVNELAKFRYRSGNQWSAGGVTLRAPCGAVGHGGHYHSQSPEAYVGHTPGLVVVMPRGPATAKGLLLAAIRAPDPVIFLEPKALYRAAVEPVPVGDITLPLGQAEILRPGRDVTVVGWGAQLRRLQTACDIAAQQYQIDCELIDLQTLLPWDVETVVASVQRTGKCVVSHEAPLTGGWGAEIVATLQERCFYQLEAPIQRVCGYDTPFPLVYEKYYLPDEWKNLAAIVAVMEQAQ